MWVHSLAAAGALATAMVAGATRFDGLYGGSASVVTQNVFCSGPPVPMQLTVNNGDVIRQYEISSASSALADPNQLLKVPVAPDGSFRGTMNVLVGHMSWVTVRLRGQITGAQLSADEEWPLCSFHWSLTKLAASS